MNRPEKELKVRCAFDNQGQLVIPYKDIKKQWEELNEYCDYLEQNRKVKIATVDVKCSDFEEVRQLVKKLSDAYSLLADWYEVMAKCEYCPLCDECDHYDCGDKIMAYCVREVDKKSIKARLCEEE